MKEGTQTTANGFQAVQEERGPTSVIFLFQNLCVLADTLWPVSVLDGKNTYDRIK